MVEEKKQEIKEKKVEETKKPVEQPKEKVEEKKTEDKKKPEKKKDRQDMMDRAFHLGKYKHYNVSTHILHDARTIPVWSAWVKEGK